MRRIALQSRHSETAVPGVQRIISSSVMMRTLKPLQRSSFPLFLVMFLFLCLTMVCGGVCCRSPDRLAQRAPPAPRPRPAPALWPKHGFHWVWPPSEALEPHHRGHLRLIQHIHQKISRAQAAHSTDDLHIIGFIATLNIRTGLATISNTLIDPAVQFVRADNKTQCMYDRIGGVRGHTTGLSHHFRHVASILSRNEAVSGRQRLQVLTCLRTAFIATKLARCYFPSTAAAYI